MKKRLVAAGLGLGTFGLLPFWNRDGWESWFMRLPGEPPRGFQPGYFYTSAGSGDDAVRFSQYLSHCGFSEPFAPLGTVRPLGEALATGAISVAAVLLVAGAFQLVQARLLPRRLPRRLVLAVNAAFALGVIAAWLKRITVDFRLSDLLAPACVPHHVCCGLVLGAFFALTVLELRSPRPS